MFYHWMESVKVAGSLSVNWVNKEVHLVPKYYIVQYSRRPGSWVDVIGVGFIVGQIR